ncbi:MAG: ABC transporter substrate-binding protein/permease [Eubacteriales bacterium]|nr:ABC transporter substrate-binding protein/permease [Eubacteriales bacterium]
MLRKRTLALFMALLCALGALCCGASAEQESAEPCQEDFEHAVLGVLTGSFYDDIAREMYPEAKIRYYDSLTDLLVSAQQGKIDAFYTYTSSYVSMKWDGIRLKIVGEPVSSMNVAFGFALDQADGLVMRRLNAFLQEKEADGTLREVHKKWIGDEEPTEHPDYSTLTGENGTLRVAVVEGLRPTVYQIGSGFTGYEIELLTMFAREYGYKLELTGLKFDGVIPGLMSGKFDLAAATLAVTPERMESIAFSHPHSVEYGYLVVSEGAEESGSFWADIRESFEKTFVREERWKLIVEGVAVTTIISLFSALGGSVLGFGLYLLSRSECRPLGAAAKGIAKVYTRIVAGTPVVVILMILFYIVFGRMRDASGILVAILGFSLTFGAFVYSHMALSVAGVDVGQTEAAFALGYTPRRTFFRILLPQAMAFFLPSYCAEIVSLVKATAVVGYIAVNDLTRMGDVIRSNTYEAFFPLMATALIYFMLTWAFSLVLGRIMQSFEPKRRSEEKILRGIREK